MVIQFSKPNARDRKRTEALLDFIDEINENGGMRAASWSALNWFIYHFSKELIDLNCKQKISDKYEEIDQMIKEHTKN